MAYSIVEWATGSVAYLASVPWDASYKDVLAWTPEERDTYIKNATTAKWTLEDMQYLKPGEPIVVPLMYDDVWRVNYIMVVNESCPTSSTTPPTLCYFVTNVAYLNTCASTLTLQLDVWNTFALDMKLGHCYVERGHIAQVAFESWYQRQIGSLTDPDMISEARYRATNRYLLEPEGLDLGNEYQVAYHTHVDLTRFNNSEGEGAELGVVIVSSVNLGGSWGTESAPEINTPGAFIISGTVTCLDVYYMALSDWLGLTSDMREYPWISKGISNVYIVPRGMLNLGENAENIGPNKRPGFRVEGGIRSNVNEAFDEGVYELIEGFFTRASLGDKVDFAKFFTYPYAYFMIDTNEGDPLLLKPELCQSGRIQLGVESTFAPPCTKVAIVPFGYGTSPLSQGYGQNIYHYLTARYPDGEGVAEQAKGGYGYQDVAWIKNVPQTQVVNDEYNYYLASTYNTRQANYAGASWSLARSNAATNLQYSQAMQNVVNDSVNNQLRNQQVQNSVLGGLANTALGAIGSAVGGNVFGALSGIGSGLIGAGVTVANNDLTNQRIANNQSLAVSLAGQNQGLAQWAAQGDYQQQIRALNATVQDAAVVQPSVSGMAGGDAFNVEHGLYGFDVYLMVPSWTALLKVADFWARYGYAVNRWCDLTSRTAKTLLMTESYQYYKMQDTTIVEWSGDDSTREVVRGILERGVTLWANPGLIGNAGLGGASNAPVVNDSYNYWY